MGSVLELQTVTVAGIFTKEEVVLEVKNVAISRYVHRPEGFIAPVCGQMIVIPVVDFWPPLVGPNLGFPSISMLLTMLLLGLCPGPAGFRCCVFRPVKLRLARQEPPSESEEDVVDEDVEEDAVDADAKEDVIDPDVKEDDGGASVDGIEWGKA